MTEPTQPPRPSSKAELLENIYAGKARFDRLIAGLSHAELTATPDAAGWTVQDHLAHLVAWEQILLGALAGRSDHEAAEVDEATHRDLSMDQLNDILCQRYRGKSVAEVIDLYHQSHAAVLAAIDHLDDTILYAPSQPEPDSTPRIDKIRWNTYEHSDEHIGWILAQLGKGS